MPYPQSKQLGKKFISPTGRGIYIIFKVGNFNHTRLSDGDQSTPKGLETESSK